MSDNWKRDRIDTVESLVVDALKDANELQRPGLESTLTWLEYQREGIND